MTAAIPGHEPIRAENEPIVHLLPFFVLWLKSWKIPPNMDGGEMNIIRTKNQTGLLASATCNDVMNVEYRFSQVFIK
ncbi:hypothetical protein [Paenibacillus lemnae]|uniref:Uncharacterized protein n=1 Tax=Paenibacillus lemnae TaxID=1330551 RepID=A0A848MA19_PAELE|nr:hypothetical protein [Paenibacillus lemnae]NMO97010.1 hypothetical protein [Paenibacillus lemnae]